MSEWVKVKEGGKGGKGKAKRTKRGGREGGRIGQHYTLSTVMFIYDY